MYQLLIPLLCVFLGRPADAAPTRETAQDLVIKAQNLALQKDRLQATRLLIRGVEKEAGEGRKKLLAALKEISEIFFTEKGQQVFERGQTLRGAALPSAIEKLREAWALEVGNTVVGRALVRSLLQAGQCEEASELADKVLSYNPYSEELSLSLSQALICNGKVPDGLIILKRLEQRKGPLRLYVETLKAQAALFDGKLDVASEHLRKAEDLDSLFPEIHYWRGQVLLKSKVDPRASLEKYVALCAKVEPKIRLKYEAEPRLCLETAAMQKLLAEGRPVETRSGAPE